MSDLYKETKKRVLEEIKNTKQYEQRRNDIFNGINNLAQELNLIVNVCDDNSYYIINKDANMFKKYFIGFFGVNCGTSHENLYKELVKVKLLKELDETDKKTKI